MLLLQLRARDLADTHDDLDPVASWLNAQGISVLQGTAGFRPIFHTNEINGWDGVKFDGVDDRMSTDLAIAASPFSIFVVYRVDFSGSASRRVVQGSNNWLMGPYSGTVNHYDGAGFAGSMNHALNGLYISSVINNGVTSQHRAYNGTSFINTAAGVGVPATLGLGAQGAFAEPAQSTILEIRVYDTALSDIERDAVEAELFPYYGLAPSPYFESDPFDIANVVFEDFNILYPGNDSEVEVGIIDVIWDTPTTEDPLPIGAVIEYEIEVDYGSGVFVTLAVGVLENTILLNLIPYVGSTITIRVIASVGGSEIEAETTFLVVPIITPCTVIEPVYAEVSQDGRASCGGISPNFSNEDPIISTFDSETCGVPPTTKVC